MRSALHCLVVALSLLALAPNVNGSLRNHVIGRRAAFLTLNLIDIRCPSKMDQYIRSTASYFSTSALEEFNKLNGRRLLGISSSLEKEIEDIELELISEGLSGADPSTFSRHLLGRQKPGGGGGFTLKEWRVNARKTAVYQADQFCGGAPDDKGPGAIFPLHLDITVKPAPSPTESPYQAVKVDDSRKPTPAPQTFETPYNPLAQTPEDARLAESMLPEENLSVEPVVLEDSGPNAMLVMGLLLLIGVGVGVGVTLYVVKGGSKDNSGGKGDKNEVKNLKAKLKKLREVVEG